ncbi:hypothetical protein N0V90_007464 [Kalmusia sp. IMI 367209]|nr:hypothetical protein N0V90_007464 [Kalmusia sp. IMI 367209]
MSPLPPIVVSPVLREAAKIKIEELERFKASFKSRYEANPCHEDDSRDAVLARLTDQLDRIKKLDPFIVVDDNLSMWTRRVEQAKNDKSITREKLLKLERDLLSKFEQHANRLDISSLHIVLLQEALHVPDERADLGTKLDKMALDDEFELVEEELEGVYESFEEHTFSKKDIDVKAIEEYLTSFYEDGTARFSLEDIRRQMKRYGKAILTGDDELDDDIVEWCVTDLLKNDLLSEEKKRTLQGYLQSPAAIRELTDTLNVKSVRHWNWRNGDKGLPVSAQQNAEGKYCITVEEEVIDMLFLHTIALGWSMKLKECLSGVAYTKDVWPGTKHFTLEENQKFEYYLRGPCLQSNSCTTCHGPPMPPSPMMPPPPPGMNHSRRRRAVPPPAPRAKPRKRAYIAPPMPPPFYGTMILNDERTRAYLQDFFLSRLPKPEGCAASRADAAETQARLLKTLVLETKIREAFDGSVHGISANFNSFASSLPHPTILAVLGFLGMPEEWLDVFKRFLAAPLNMGPVVRGTSDLVRTRTSGVPVAHGLETFFGEAVLSFLDLAVHQKTRAYLLRLRDKCYFVGEEKQCKDALDEIENFAKIMGLDVSTNNLFDGESIGFVTFDRKKSNRVALDSVKVAGYARRIKKQLSACSTVLEWVRTWNNTIGTFAPHLFGPLANVFGKSHLEAVTRAYNLIFEIIFDGGNLTDHVKHMIQSRTTMQLSDQTSCIEAIVHLPNAYGGLGVKNPYTALNLANGVLEDPDSQLVEYLKAEKKYYEFSSKMFGELTPKQREDKLKALFTENEERQAAVLGSDVHKFFTHDELTAARERGSLIQYPTNPFAVPYGHPSYPYPSPYIDSPPQPFVPIPDLLSTYLFLSAEPMNPFISASDKIREEVYKLSDRLDMKRWNKLSTEDKWVVGLYGDDCFEKYGGLEIWHGDSVPRELLKTVRGEERWVEDDADSESSYVSIE